MIGIDANERIEQVGEWKRPTLTRIRLDQAEATGDKLGSGTDGVKQTAYTG